ncbi:oxidoreductase [Candidatus Ozemobacteraceae bacterium]|nr:oxidoreductase [Candidatus Ozemobacteraceae bacterium]
MNILAGGEWRSGFPDYFRGPGQVRVRILAFRNLARIEGLYFVRPRSMRLLVNYLFEFGLRGVVRKVRSRLGEKYRNEKYISFGIGMILEADAGSVHAVGNIVAFLAPCHPACVERIVLDDGLAVPLESGHRFDEHVVLHGGPGETLPDADFWNGLAGFSEHAGRVLDAATLADLHDRLKRAASAEPWAACMSYAVHERDGASSVSETVAAEGADSSRKGSAKPSGIVYGYGNYAKSFLIPNASPFIEIRKVHEIDPTQIPLEERGYAWDTAPLPRPDERADVFFGAGYHHTHVPVALAALRQGAYAVIEKPVAVDERQLGELLEALNVAGPKLFSCYHKRYIPFNIYAGEDLGLRPGVPVSYSCVVYEVPLPKRHWYHWPNAKSRLVSNGCHWIDHFLFLNGFPEVRSFDLAIAPDGTLNVSVTAGNGAFFTMVLTDRGSERVGLRDYIELRTADSTVRMTDGSTYVAEGPDRVIRRASINKLFSYQNMYATISEKISRGEPGDTVESVRISAGLILDLERLFRTRCGAAS